MIMSQSLTFMLELIIANKYPLKIFGNICPNDCKFLNKILDTVCVFMPTQNHKNFIEIYPTLPKLSHIKRNHLLNFHISQEKRERLRCLCNGMMYLHKIWHDDAECVSQVHRLLKI